MAHGMRRRPWSRDLFNLTRAQGERGCSGKQEIMAEHNRVALVTGGARGIGAAICTTLAQSGHRVAVNFHSREEAANTLVAAIERQGGSAIAIAGDVANADSVGHMVRDVEQALGPVTILVNNAALTDV